MLSLSPLLFGLGLLHATADVAQAGIGMVIASDSDCPSAAAIRDELGSLKYPTPEAASVAIHADAEEVSVTFGAPAGVQRGPRKLALPPECPRRAATVALLIAAWLGRIPSGPPPSLTMVAEPAPLPPRAPDPRDREQSQLAAGVSAYMNAGHLIPALRVELGVGTEGSGTGWQLAAMLPTPAQQRIGVGTVNWMRPALLAARRLRTVSGGVSLDATVGALLGLTLAWGGGSYGRQDNGTIVGGTVGLRLCAFPGGLGPWVELRGRGWVTEQHLGWDRDSYGLVTLPVIEMELTFGASLPL
jgi:hypothetical protein